MADRYPHSLAVERALLGACLLDPSGLDRVAAWLEAGAFYRVAHQLVYAALLRLRDSGRAIDLVTVAEELRRHGELEDVGGPAYLAGLVDGMPRTNAVETYARELLALASRRRAIQAATRLAECAADESKPLDQIVDETQEVLAGLRLAGESAVVPMADVVAESIPFIEALIDGTGEPGIPTGIASLDQLTLGLQAGSLIILAARPSMGKSAMAIQIARHVSRTSGQVLLASLEMSRQEIELRLLALESGVSSYRLRRGALTAEERSALIAASERLAQLPIDIADRPPMTVASIRSWARQLAARARLRLVVVDYLQMLSPVGPSRENRVVELGEMTASLKRLARELELPVLALSQLSRAPEQRASKRPQLADLRESGSLEQDADLVLLLYRPEQYPELARPENRGDAELIVAKHRHGPTGLLKLRWEPDLMRFSDRGGADAIQTDVA